MNQVKHGETIIEQQMQWNATHFSVPSGNLVFITNYDGTKVDIQGVAPANYRIRFTNLDTGMVEYETTIPNGQWARPNIHYVVRWRVEVWENDVLLGIYETSFKGKNVWIALGSGALGDNMAWMPYLEEFRVKHECNVFAVTEYSRLFASMYPEITFVTSSKDPKYLDEHVYDYGYCIGANDNDYNRNKNNWRGIPLQQTATDYLGLDYKPVRCRLAHQGRRPIKGKYVAISEYSTFLGKHWNRPGAWQEVVDYLVGLGYKVASVSREPSTLKNVIHFHDQSIENTINNIAHANFYIGVSSGLCVIAWSLAIPTIVISGFTPKFGEPEGVLRVINENVCHGCMGDFNYPLDRGNWRYCPRSRNFECSREITVESVTSVIDQIAAYKYQDPYNETVSVDENTVAKRILYLTPHCSTGGGPQYLLRCVEEMKAKGYEIEVVEYDNISDSYVVQKNKIKALVPFHTLNGNKADTFREIRSRFHPSVIHVHEFAERFMTDEFAAMLYHNTRDYRIIETPHGDGIYPKDIKWRPDSFAFVSLYHKEMFSKLRIPVCVIEYVLPKRQRPNRTEALHALALDANYRHILNVGLFAPHKNQAEIFAIARLLPDTMFHFVGNAASNFKDYWKPLIDVNCPANCVIWGEKEDLDPFYSAMDAFLFTSKMELNPLVVKEALSWSMPILMRNLPTYCGSYDKEPLVTFIDDDIERTCQLLNPMNSMASALEAVYGLGGRR
jgi:autotransporter strand-loop-strand O-heptosyltransferase